MFPFEFLGVKSDPAKSASNPCRMFDIIFTFRSRILWSVTQRCIRRHLDLDSDKLLATAVVSSRLH